MRGQDGVNRSRGGGVRTNRSKGVDQLVKQRTGRGRKGRRKMGWKTMDGGKELRTEREREGEDGGKSNPSILVLSRPLLALDGPACCCPRTCRQSKMRLGLKSPGRGAALVTGAAVVLRWVLQGLIRKAACLVSLLRTQRVITASQDSQPPPRRTP